MSPIVQSLESRCLLSASLPQVIAGTVLQYLTGSNGTTIIADEGALVGDARSIRSDVRHFDSLLKNDARVVQADVRGLPSNAANRTLVGTLRTDVQQAISTLGKDASNLIRVGSSDARKALADGIAVFFKPNNSAARSRLAADITRLQNDTAAPIATILNDATTFQNRVSVDLTALANANPANSALHTHAQAANADTSTALATARADVSKVQGDLTKLLHDLA